MLSTALLFWGNSPSLLRVIVPVMLKVYAMLISSPVFFNLLAAFAVLGGAVFVFVISWIPATPGILRIPESLGGHGIPGDSSDSSDS